MSGHVLSNEEIDLDERSIVESDFCYLGLGADELVMNYIATIRYMQDMDRDHEKWITGIIENMKKKIENLRKENDIMRDSLNWYANASDYELVDSQYIARDAIIKIEEINHE